MERISKKQLFIMIMYFQIGTTIIFGFSAQSGRNAWLGVLVSVGLGLLAIGIYLALMKLLPGLTLMEWYPAVLGKWFGVPISWLYPLMFLYVSGRVLADLRDLIPTTILPSTPPYFFLGVFMCFIAYALYHGLESFGRLCEIMFPIIIGSFVVVVILLIGSDIIRLKHLFPIMEQGFGEVWTSVWPAGVTQTFGETIVFAMFWPMVKQQGQISKTVVMATLSSSLLILIVDLLCITTLGEGMFAASIYPMYTVIRLISIAEFIEHLDAIAVLYFINTAFFKVAIYMLAAMYGIQRLLLMTNRRMLPIPFAAAVLFMGLTMSDSIQEHIFGVHMNILSPYFWVPLYIVAPALLVIVALIRRWYSALLSRR
ncbi:GerAB/ArcD/ProY family transporter [Paenibacillus chartarius]|uniref:GerAB/ArcD/ProY family transporter n=1 Tax=Paenibacillus chartarius TaxID=747481 RepID=A0ABV6DQM2_9BACL